MTSPKVIIVGAGPAGLTAASEIQRLQPAAQVIVLEKDPEYVGGISRTVRYKEFRFDIGGHRFFSKNQEIMAWWERQLPNDFIKVPRLSRIYYGGKFYDYPLRAWNAFSNLGPLRSALCLLSYIWARILPIFPETSFEDWVTNRFGRRLFLTFFKSYTEKVWGRPCSQINADWAAQRIKGLSLTKAVWHALFPSSGKDVKTLIHQFNYPRLGPGMMWESVAKNITAKGAIIQMGAEVQRIHHNNSRITHISTLKKDKGEAEEIAGDHFILSMPLAETVEKLFPLPPPEVLAAARRLPFRDFLTVALIIEGTNHFPDNWVYIHEPSVRVGRVQNFNNWSPEMVGLRGVTCLGLEYFCQEGDDLWTMSDSKLVEFAARELQSINLIRGGVRVQDGTVVRMPKAYPVYTPTYSEDIHLIKTYLSQFANLGVAGRNGMHKYNNQDHSMLTALIAARNATGDKSQNVWNVNSDAEYHEESKA
jgi:protoporphyrinogen oxidase